MHQVPLHEVSCACLPLAALPVLAGLRHVAGVRVRLLEDCAWVWWEAGDEQVLRQVLAAPGVALYERRATLWYPHEHALPAFHVPAELDTRPLHQALTPAPVLPREAVPRQWSPVPLRLVRDEQPRTTTAVLAEAKVLAEWVANVPTAVLAALSAAHSEDRVLLRGRTLPALPGGERFWGHRLLIPLGLRAEPALPERALREAFGAGEHELALFTVSGIELVSLDAFEPLTRAGARLVLR